MALVRYPSVHGAIRSGGYPLANFISGAAWEFYDVVRVSTKFRTSKVTKEIFEKPGSRGNLVFMISNNHYWDFHGDLLGKCYGTQIYVPIQSMGSSRSMDVERLGEQALSFINVFFGEHGAGFTGQGFGFVGQRSHVQCQLMRADCQGMIQFHFRYGGIGGGFVVIA